MDFINTLLPKLEGLGIMGYWVVLLVTMSESLAFVGLVIPGTVITVLVGFLAANGTFELDKLVWFATAGAIIGDGVSFYLGRKGIGLFSKKGRFFKRYYLEKGERFFYRHGGKSVFLGRFIGPMRPVIPFVAGIVGMKKRDFFLYNITSAFAWSLSFLLAGYFFGGVWKTIVLWSTRAEFFLLALFIVIALFYLSKWLIIKKGKRFFLIARSVSVSVSHALFENEEVRRMVARYPSFFRFLKNRFRRGEITGLTLTLGGLVFGYLIFLFLGIVENILKSGMIVEIDTRAESLLFMFRNSFFLSFFTWVSFLGKSYVLAVFAFLFSVSLWFWNKKRYLISLWITLVGSQLFGVLSKLALRRARPETAFYSEDSFSFPSGHAAISMAFYGFFIYVFWQQSKSWNRKVNAFFLGFVIVLAIGFSRLYLGAHYLSDVLGGYIVGLLWIIFSINASNWITWFKGENLPARMNIKKIFLALFGLAIIFFVIFGNFYHLRVREVKPKEGLNIAVHDSLEIFSQHHLSSYSEKLSGLPQEPISIIIQARTDDEIIEVFEEAGWHVADALATHSLLRIVSAFILNESYPTAPMTPSFWNSQVHDFGFEKPTEKDSARARHHARFWKTGAKTEEGKYIYVGVASLDVGIKYIVAHTISPDIDTEREFVFSDLEKTSRISAYRKEQFVNPALGKNFAGDQFFTDGKVYVIDVK